jgi:putative tryptophan/tyrosine transport system substrate-binding protein
MKRRQFIALLGGTVAMSSLPLAARAQQPGKVARIGFLSMISAPTFAIYLDGFRAGLRDLGYVEGKNIAIEFRWADGSYDRLPALAAELVRLDVDVLVTYTTLGARAAQSATTTIPIVVATMPDALATGLITSLANPGGNLTGMTFFNPELMAKRLELLKEAAPSVSRAAVLLNPDNPANGLVLQAMETTAKTLNVELQPIETRGPSEFERAFAAMADQQIGAVVIHDDPILLTGAKTIADLAAKQRLPSIGTTELTSAGGLMAYGVDFAAMFRQAAIFVDKILKGAMPGNLPVERSTRFKFVINLQTAKTLGIKIPPMLLARTDEVIE